MIIRTGFFDFLTKQFCQENMQFYEVVQDWKVLPETERTARAQDVVKVFIGENAAYQVHLNSDLVEAISAGLEVNPISSNLFDEALKELVMDMYQNSFQPFWNIWSKEHSSII